MELASTSSDVDAAQDTLDEGEEDAEEEERLRECYHAFLARRVARGGRSIRTRRGYEQLRASYQMRVRFLLEQAAPGVSASEGSDCSLRDLVGPYVDPRVLKFVAEECWPLAHFGSRGANSNTRIPEWQELGSSRYFTVMVNALLWMFPGLPTIEVQELMERDWQNDRDFDPYGNGGLSLEGFTVSLIDLAVACTNGNVDRCLEFLRHLVDRLETSLPLVHSDQFKSLQNEEADNTSPVSLISTKQLRWRTIPLGQLVPCKPQQKPRYYELKAKASVSPMVLMVLAGKEIPCELQLSSSAKLLVRERDSRTSVRRKTIALKTHLVEMEKQIMWTLRGLGGDQPSVLLIPSASISQRSLWLYGCLRLLDSHEQELHHGTGEESANSNGTPSSLFTMHTSIQEPTSITYGSNESVCGRIDRQSTQLFVLDHRLRRDAFVVTLKTSLLQSTNSGGGAGAAAVVAQSLTATTHMVIDDERASMAMTNSEADGLSPHTFVFVIKDQNEFATPRSSGVHRQTVSLPRQWYCAMSAADEAKQIVVKAPTSPDQVASGLYYLYIFSLHGVYYEVVYDKMPDGDEVPTSDSVAAYSDTQALPQESQCGDDSPCSEQDEEAKELSTEATNGQLTGVALLRCLLKLREKRKKQAQAEPLPEFIGGTKFTGTKSLTAAASLRGKVLKARELARQARVVEREKAFANSLLELMTKHSTTTKRSGHPPTSNGSPDKLLPCKPSSVSAEGSKNALDTQVKLLASFFREMAVYIPPEPDDRRESDTVDANLVDQFRELFEHDTKLLNILDEEKWLPDEHRSKQTQPSRDATSDNDASDAEPVHADYINTARYIEELMRDAVQQEQAKSVSLDTDEQQEACTTDPIQHLQASWTYAQQRSHAEIQRSKYSETQRQQLEAVRRGEWMKSHYVTDLAPQARFAASSPIRTPMSLSKPAFNADSQRLPWSPIWEIPNNTVESTSGCFSPKQRELSACDAPLSPKRPQHRPKTTSTTERDTRSGARINDGEKKLRSADAEVAAASASFAYVNRLRFERVRTAGSRRQDRQMPSRPEQPSRPTTKIALQKSHASQPPANQSNNDTDHIECDLSNTLAELDYPTSIQPLPESDTECKGKPPDLKPPSPVKCSTEVTNGKTDEVCSPSEATQSNRKKRGRRKTINKRASNMRQQVKELLAISKAVTEYSRTTDSAVEVGFYPATADLPIPARSQTHAKRPG